MDISLTTRAIHHRKQLPIGASYNSHLIATCVWVILLILCTGVIFDIEVNAKVRTSTMSATFREVNVDDVSHRVNTTSTPLGGLDVIKQGPDILSVSNAIVQGLTLIVVIIYTVLTGRMQQVMARQIKLSVMPAFVLSLIQMNMKDATLDVHTFALQITNIGSGTALNIQLEPILLSSLIEKRRKLGEPNIKFEAIGLMKREDKQLVSHHSYSSDQLINGDFLIDLEDHLGKADNNEISIRIKFQDIEGDQYRQTIRLTRSGCKPSAVELIAS